MKKILGSIAVLALLGVAVSAYSLSHHVGFASGELCSPTDTCNCDILNQGPYSEIGGVPVALIGVIGYWFLILAAFLNYKKQDDTSITRILVLASMGATAFALYLTSIEAFVLETWCLLCLSSQAIIAAIFLLSIRLHLIEKHDCKV